MPRIEFEVLQPTLRRGAPNADGAPKAIQTEVRVSVGEAFYGGSTETCYPSPDDLLADPSRFVGRTDIVLFLLYPHQGKQLQKLVDKGLAGSISGLDVAVIPDADGFGWQALPQFTQLQTLNCCLWKLTEGHMRIIGRLSELRNLDLGYTEIDDAAAMHLAGLTQLTHLNLTSTQVTPKLFPILTGLSHLQELRISSENLEYKDLAILQKQLPNCRIKHLIALESQDIQ